MFPFCFHQLNMFLLFLTTIKPALMKNTANLILKKLSNGIDRIVLAKTETGVWCLLITDLVRTSLMIMNMVIMILIASVVNTLRSRCWL